MKHWTDTFFIEKGKLWLHFMNRGWKYAARTSRAIVKVLKKHGISKGRILEVCCGNGRICLNLARKGYRVTGVDISADYIHDAKRKAEKRKTEIKFVCGDMRRIDSIVRGPFDAVINIWTAIGYYDKKTDEKFLKKTYSLLKKNGVLMILNTMSVDFLSHYFVPTRYDETDKYVILHNGTFDRFHSINEDNWMFYKKENKNLEYVDTCAVRLRLYSLNEIVEMAENAGFRFAEAYDTLISLAPVRPDSRINVVFIK